MAFSEFSGSSARRFVRALVKFYYPRIEVTGADRIPQDGPVLLVANHPNSLIDPVLLGVAARRPVSLMAKAPLFDIPLFGKVLRALGMVPAYRGVDDRLLVARNLESIALAAKHLAKTGGVMGIFPEGKSHDAPQLAQVRSGAARLAMQALAAGAKDLKVVPVGLHYEEKARFRSAVWIKVGEPVDAAAWLAQNAGDDHLAMRTLTAELNTRLKTVVLHLDEAGWQPLLEDLQALLPAAGFRRRNALDGLHRQQAAVDAINYFHRTDRPRAEAAAARVQAHSAALRGAGVPADDLEISLQGRMLVGAFLLTTLKLVAGAVFGFFGLVTHLAPYLFVRFVSAWIPAPGQMTLALNRLLLGLPVYGGWYALMAWWLGDYFLPWVVVTWLVLMPVSALVALDNARRWRSLAPRLRVTVRLLFRSKLRAELLASQAAVVAELGGLAKEFYAVSPPLPAVAATRRYRPPLWLNVTVGAVCLACVVWFSAWLLRDRPTEYLRGDAPDIAALTPAQLTEQMSADERSLVVAIDGLAELEKTFQAFDVELKAGKRSYYTQADDDEMRRLLLSFLSYRAVLLRTVWKYQRNEDVKSEADRLRALLLHYTAAAVAYDYSARFVHAFAGRELPIKKLNEAEPRWDLPAGTYDLIRANLANAAHRRWLETGWKNYQRTLPEWQAAGLTTGEPYEKFHASIMLAAANTAKLSDELFAYKVDTALSEVTGAAKGGYYRASSAISTLIGDTKIREPRHGKPLVTPELMERLRPLLQPGDIIVERRNWYLSNAFLPGYWPHSALYVGTPEQLKAEGIDQDLRIRHHLEEFSKPDASGHVHAIIEAVSEGVVFSTVEHSIGEADSVAILRPNLTPLQKREVIARAFDHAGKPYDFDFDFFSADKLVCTELVYRSLNGMIDFPLVEILGRKTLPAVEIVRYWVSGEGGPLMTFVAFLDGDERTGKCVWAGPDDLAASVNRPALTWLQ